MPGRRTVWLIVFALAMGLLEAAVVVYLRALYYPQGFGFPIAPMDQQIFVVELVREGTTFVMLLTVAALAGRDRLDRFFVFGFLFGVWDIVYYLGLWLFLRWPASPFTWDVLFLIPVPWLAPVIYPVIVSAVLVCGFIVHRALRAAGRALRPTFPEWLFASAGGLIVILSFCWHWRVVVEGRVPTGFPAPLFVAGLLLGALPFVRAGWRVRPGAPRASD